MKIALLVIATGQRYRDFARQMMASAKQFLFPHDVIIFTDEVREFQDIENVIPVEYTFQGFPEASYRRYHAFVQAKDLLLNYSYVYYCDSDMRWVAPVTQDEITANGIVATYHPGYFKGRGTPELRPESTAYCPEPRFYACGGFQGGSSQAFVRMSEEIARRIDIDDANGIRAIWVDESQFNRYLFDYPPARILTPAFCYPEDNLAHYRNVWAHAGVSDFDPKLMALTKKSC